jgi:asparagine synthase (glutamine-hydrolysing)
LTPKSGSNVGLDYLVEKFTEAAALDRVERHTIWFGAMSPTLQGRVLAPGVQDVLAGDDPMASSRDVLAGRDLPDSLSELLYMDFRLYLAEDLLTKVDRSTMLTSLEARAPFLDHELAEFVAGLPSRMKLDGFKTKAILRRAAARHLPKEVLGRRKRGFNIPFSRWLHHGLGTEMQRRFSRERVETRGLFDFEGVQALIDDHLAHRADHRKPLFALLAFDLWCDKVYGDGGAIPHAGVAR